MRKDASVGTLRNRQLDAFEENFAKVNMTQAKRRNLDPYDVLIIASMVEREARVAKERPIISAVIQNRLRENVPLGIDATIRYATGNWSTPLTQSDLRRNSPVQHAPAPRAPADADRQPWPGVDQGGREPCQPATTSTTS